MIQPEDSFEHKTQQLAAKRATTGSLPPPPAMDERILCHSCTCKQEPPGADPGFLEGEDVAMMNCVSWSIAGINPSSHDRKPGGAPTIEITAPHPQMWS